MPVHHTTKAAYVFGAVAVLVLAGCGAEDDLRDVAEDTKLPIDVAKTGDDTPRRPRSTAVGRRSVRTPRAAQCRWPDGSDRPDLHDDRRRRHQAADGGRSHLGLGRSARVNTTFACRIATLYGHHAACLNM